SSYAQSEQYNQFSVELTTGVDVPLVTRGHMARSDYISFPQFQLSLRYMFNPKFGLKGHYGYNLFKDSKDVGPNITFHRLAVEGVVNLNQTFHQFFYVNLNLPE